MRLVYFKSISGAEYYLNPDHVHLVWTYEGSNDRTTIVVGSGEDDYIEVASELSDVANKLKGN